MNSSERQKLITYLTQFVTANRWEKIKATAPLRTNYVTVVLEDVYQPHNMSAALRSAECFGVQSVHIIEHRNTYKIDQSVAKGAGDWLTVATHSKTTTSTVFDNLRRQGYTVVATSPHAKGYQLHELPVDKKIALVFGTEETGLSAEALDAADAYVAIPMHGFTESFNISVSVALCLYDITTRLRASAMPWQLSQDEIEQLHLEWLSRSVRNADLLIKLYNEQQK